VAFRDLAPVTATIRSSFKPCSAAGS